MAFFRRLRRFLAKLRCIGDSLEQLNQRLESAQAQLENMMAKLQDFQALLDAVNRETDRIAGVITEANDRVQSGMSNEEEDQVHTLLSSAVDRLRVIGADPADPIPEPPAGDEPLGTSRKR